MKNTIVNYRNFIFATRDSGYKCFSSAIAELVDNSLEAKATIINISILGDIEKKEVIVSDNGIGMDKNILRIAFQFGGTTRHNSRVSIGRYGMGLPNSSLSQARRFEVYTWQHSEKILTSYLDIDEILNNKTENLHEPATFVNSDLDISKIITGKHGTIVRWINCDRLKDIKISTLVRELHNELGRIFRLKIKEGIKIKINNKTILPFDPLYLDYNIENRKAVQYGDTIQFPIHVTRNSITSIVKIRFSELPIKDWSTLSNLDKRKYNITQKAGCSILRAEREIDYGWFFFGAKRKENYDDWWRCEISFEPELDEIFGVTHTKQSINPTDYIKDILTPTVENTARVLNRKVRDNFLEIKNSQNSYLQKITSNNDHLIEKPSKKVFNVKIDKNTKTKKTDFANVHYTIKYNEISTQLLFVIHYRNKELTININKEHLFYTKILNHLNKNSIDDKNIKFIIELIIASMSRMFINLKTQKERDFITQYNLGWSNILTSFLQ